jgi:hypothetical protein
MKTYKELLEAKIVIKSKGYADMLTDIVKTYKYNINDLSKEDQERLGKAYELGSLESQDKSDKEAERIIGRYIDSAWNEIKK